MNLPLNGDFLMSIEEECLTATPDEPARVNTAVFELLHTLSRLIPTLAAPEGIFNGYARCYPDCGHLEIALCEADSPYALARIADVVHRLIARACERLQAGGVRLLLANNNHSGVLHEGCAMWGAHENHLVDRNPCEDAFAQLILPFLITRLYAGSGGVESPTGAYLASVRALCMEQATGGSTTSGRAIVSYSRNEHHMGRRPRRFRFHGLLADGHRSQFNLALQLGATALALKAVTFDPQLPAELAPIHELLGGDWLGALRRFNVLQTARGELQIDPMVIRVQSIYLNAARRCLARLPNPPEWTARTLSDWEATLTAYERLDRPWLAARLDAFAKYELFSGVLENQRLGWADLTRRAGMFAELALLNHSYHNFVDPDSVFCLLEQQRLLAHRVGPTIVPGEEPEPFVPETTTRAQARARFIREHSGQGQFIVDWSCVWDRAQQRVAHLDDPFAAELGEWKPLSIPAEVEAGRLSIRHLQRLVVEAADILF